MVTYLCIESSEFLELSKMNELCLCRGVSVSLFKMVHERLDKQYPYGKVFDSERLLSKLVSSNLTVNALMAVSDLVGWKIPKTDGVRALVSPDKLSLMDSLKKFLRYGTISPSFCSLYAQAFIRMLRTSPSMMDIKTIAIAEDGRDYFAHTDLKNALIQGLSVSGVKVEDLEIVPTPFLAAYSLSHGIPAIMLTASHNPAAYNGLKLFIDGRKLYPEGPVGEYCLSWHVADIVSRPESKFYPNNVSPIIVNKVPSVTDRAIVLLDSMLVQDFPVQLLQDAPLILDTANGAYSGIAQKYLQSKGIPFVPFACTPGVGAINHECGAGELESLPQELRYSDSLPGNVRALFRMGRTHPSTRMYAVVLDGDGDRGYLLEYHKSSDIVTIYDGDELGFILAVDMVDRPLIDVNAEPTPPLVFCCTMESDASLAFTLQEHVHAKVIITCVGDRYLLKDVPSDIQRFIGCERSGHVIVPVSILSEQEDTSRKVRLFSGNGLLTVLLALPKILAAHEAGKPTIRPVHGYRVQFTIRDRVFDQFYRDSECWKSIATIVEGRLPWTCRRQEFPPEPDMLYYDLFDTESVSIGRWYMRKSGTEPKISVCLWIDKYLMEIANNISKFAYC